MDEISVLRAIAALLVVLGLLGGLYWGLRRFSHLIPNADTGADLRIVSWKAMDGRRKLSVVRWGDSEHLILSGPQGDIKVAERPAQMETDPPEAQS